MATRQKAEAPPKTPLRASTNSVKFLLPSEISFFSRVKNWSELASEERLTSIDLTAYAKRLMSHDSSYPKLQVANLNGRWFALNSLQLAICRHLEKSGYCKRIRVNVCSPQFLPEQVAVGLQLKRTRGEGRGGKDSESVSLAGASSSDSDEDSNSADDQPDSNDEVSGSDADKEQNDSDDGSCSGSDSYCSECEREVREAAKVADKKSTLCDKQTKPTTGGKLEKPTCKAVAAKCPTTSKDCSKAESMEEGPSVDRDLADLGPTTAMLLQQLDIKEAAAAAAAAAMRDRDQERQALI